jgi:hypothetical protein
MAVFARTVSLGRAHFDGGPLLLFLELIEHSIFMVSILTLLEKADEREMIIQEHIVCFGIFLLVFF